MFIYVVKPGDSLYSIAVMYQVNMDSIRIMNGLTTDSLVPGQDLLIPTNMYTVQPGDTLFLISKMSFIPIETIRLYNGLQSDFLMVGMTLYLPPPPKYSAENLSYMYPTTPEQDELIIRTFAPINTFLAMFEYHILEGGTLSTLNDEFAIQTARNNGVAPVATITNLTTEGFSPEVTRQVLTFPDQRDLLIDNIYNLVISKNYAGVNIDFERVREEERDLYSDFLRLVSDRLKPEGYSVSAAVPAKTSEDIPWLKGYDFGGIGAAVDFIFIMAYDWHVPTMEPGPVAPIDEVRKSIEFALQHMNREKIMLGVPRYGYEWTLDDDGNVISGRAVSVSGATQLALNYQVPIQYSLEYEQPFFIYWDENGNQNIVWFENAQALTAKLQLVIDYQLMGVGAWQLGLGFPQSFYLINYLFDTRHIIY
ncbi:glycosyl hydrolase family 18 protein [Solibacillus sp. FSL K6-1523]|uniref:glycosyl hydrolase family 18 protein n=1 Tax=Solibacillus sp. FSL K6-1523 TaxID=2921471 RepID=UPI0030FCC5D2